MEKTFNAIVVDEYGSEDVLKISKVPNPSLESDQVLVRVYAAGVNPVDTYIRAGNHVSAPPVPFTPGKDGAGIVSRVGDDVKSFKEGDRVYLGGSVTGTYAEYAVAHESQTHLLPDGVSFSQGAGVFVPYATAYRALVQKGGASADSRVFIHGASGAVGLAAIQFAKRAGIRTIVGSASSEAGKKVVIDAGASGVFDHSREGYLDQAKCEFGRFDLIIEMLADVNLVNDFKLIDKRGTIVIVGSRGTLEFTPRLAMTSDVTIKGMSLFNASKESMAEILSSINEGLTDGSLSPLVSNEFELADAAEAHREVIAKPSSGKIVLVNRFDSWIRDL